MKKQHKAGAQVHEGWQGESLDFREHLEVSMPSNTDFVGGEQETLGVSVRSGRHLINLIPQERGTD